MSSPLRALAELTDTAWLVGGAVRDELLGRSSSDCDVVVEDDPRPLAGALARDAGAHAFPLSGGFGAWRVVARDHSWQVDLLPLGGEAIEADLGRRDLTINAIAQPLGGGEYVDPFGGLEDLHGRRLRMVSTEAFAADPLRALRLARLHCELGFAIDPATAAAAGASSPALSQVAPERVFAELARIVSAAGALEGLALMDSLGATDVVLPELAALRRVQQSRYHHLDVHDHTRAVLAETVELQRDPGRWFPDHAEAVAGLLAEPLTNGLTRGQALRFGALLHDVAKPLTRAVSAEGRVTFAGHDTAGAEIAWAVLVRLRASTRLAEHVSALVRAHLRLGFLVHEQPLTRRAVYGYLRACEPVQIDVTLLSVADRLATRGRGAEPAIARHLQLARSLLGEALSWRADRPRPPVRGDELARAVGLAPGAELGRILGELEQASFSGEIATREQAIERARELLGAKR
jgi:putative nucleotidyltransferase with HDIG domain